MNIILGWIICLSVWNMQGDDREKSFFHQNLEFSVDVMSNEGKDDVIRISDDKQRNRGSITGLKPGEYLTWAERKLYDG